MAKVKLPTDIEDKKDIDDKPEKKPRIFSYFEEYCKKSELIAEVKYSRITEMKNLMSAISALNNNPFSITENRGFISYENMLIKYERSRLKVRKLRISSIKSTIIIYILLNNQ